MGGVHDSRAGQPRIGASAKSAFLEALRGGARREEAAAAGGFTLMGFYGARRRDPEFAAAWKEALASSAAAERRPPPEDPTAENPTAENRTGELRIAPANRRILQRRIRRNVRFDEGRRQAFLAHFVWSCDTKAAAAAAGVHESTVNLHRRNDTAFAEEFREALHQGYDLLEAEALRQRLAAQRALREAVESSEPPVSLAADVAAEFERVLKLLARWDRKARRPDARSSEGARRSVWTFEAAIELLGKKLDALGVPVQPLPPDEAERYDGPGGEAPQ